MFNCLPGAMLEKGHTHQWKKGFSCSRVPSQHNARTTASHRLFNPGRPGGKATIRNREDSLRDLWPRVRALLVPNPITTHIDILEKSVASKALNINRLAPAC